MSLEVREVSPSDVLNYIRLNKDDVNIPWIASVTNERTVGLILGNGVYAKQRKAYGLYNSDNMIGYAVIHYPTLTLDLLHLAEPYRGKGFGEWFLKELDANTVTVDASNIVAVNLYTKLGYNLEFFEEDVNVAC